MSLPLWRSARAGLRSLFRRDAVERELTDELDHYREMATLEHMRRGMSRADAERAARVAMGSVDAAKTGVRTGGWDGVVDALLQDVRVAARGLRKNRGFTVTAVLTLALGVGVTTTMFSVVNALLLRPLPYRDANRLAFIYTDDTRRALHEESTGWATVQDWKSYSRTLADVAAFSLGRVTLVASDAERSRGRARTAWVSANFFDVLGVPPAQGRLLTAVDERERANVAVISHAFWQRWFHGAPDVVGKRILLDRNPKEGGADLTVVGVLPDGFFFSGRFSEVFTPATTYWRFDRERNERFSPWARRWTALARLAPGASFPDARAELASVGRRISAANSTTLPDFPGFGANVVPMRESIAGAGTQNALWLLAGAVGLLLLLVCANVANLQLARGAARHREFAVRRALGAARRRLVGQIAAESLLLVAIGGALGVLLASWMMPLLARLAADYLPRTDQMVIDWRVLLFAGGASVASALLFGLLPALRLSSADANEALREGGRGTRSASVRRSQSGVVLVECALALVLLAGAGLLLKSLNRLNGVDPGFDPGHVLSLRIEFPSEGASGGSVSGDRARALASIQWTRDITARLEAIPGVQHAGFIDDLFITGQGNETIVIPGRSPDAIPPGELAEGAVSPGFFAAMRASLRNGRVLSADDATRKAQALWSLVPATASLAEQERLAIAEPVVVNESFVKRYFSGDDPLGKRFVVDATTKPYWYEIVGVVRDMRRKGLERQPIAEYYGPYFPSANGRADLLVRTTGEPLALASTVRAEMTRALPAGLIVSVSTVDQQLGGFSGQRRLQTWLLAAFAALGLLLAAIGIFGLSHYAVAERTREIGVRVALGATPGDVLRLMIGHGMRMPALGIAVGLTASVALTRIIASQLYDVAPSDPLTYVAVSLVLGGVSAAACYIAARRAAATDPVQALRDA